MRVTSFAWHSLGKVSASSTWASVVDHGANKRGHDNMTTLCTESCRESLSSWITAVDKACPEPITEDGIIKMASTVPLTYQEGFNLACLKDGETWCMLASQDWEGSDIRKYPSDYCASGDPEFDGPECFEEGFDQYAVDPEDTRMSNLYDQELLCSPCFMRMFRQRLLSPFLLRGSFTGYLVDEFEDMQSVCSTSMPYTTSTTSAFVGTLSRTATSTISSPSPTPTCTGRTLSGTVPALTCEQLADKYNVTTGELRHRTKSPECEFSESLCLPDACEISIVPIGSSCESLVSNFSTNVEISESQFVNWNPYLVGDCERPAWNQRVCIQPPGGLYENHHTIYNPTSTSGYYTTAIPPAPTVSGSTEACGRYYDVNDGDTCQSIALQFGISFDFFRTLNPQVDPACSNLWLGYAYCVAEVLPAPTSDNGLCGPFNDHALCGDSGFGDCCSTSGYCKYHPSHAELKTLAECSPSAPPPMAQRSPKTAPAAPTTMIGSVAIQLLASVVLCMVIVEMVSTTVDPEIATRGRANPILGAQVWMAPRPATTRNLLNNLNPPQNRPRIDGMDQDLSFDPARCAELYNRIIRIGLDGSQRSLRRERLRTSWFDAWSAHPDVAPHVPPWRARFPPLVVSFLNQIDLVVSSDGVPVVNHALAYHVQSVSPPPRLQPPELDGLEDCVLLFRNNLGALPDSVGLIMDLSDLQVSYIHDRFDWEENPQWHGLQYILERLNAIIDVRKYRPSPAESDLYDPYQAISNAWSVVPWNDWALNQSIEAYNALLQAIEARLPGSQERAEPQSCPSIATPETIDPNIKGFPRAFLLQAKKPSFKQIAPGLTVYDPTAPPPPIEVHYPSRGEPEFRTPYHCELNGYPAVSDALVLFPATEHEARERQAGLWISPDVAWADTVKLALPFELSSFPRFDGKCVPQRTSTGLWGQYRCSFFVDHGTRLVSLLGKWTELIETGVWTVSEDGVEGDIGFYRQAEEQAKSDWFVLEDCFPLR
ncbi:hypothetical protein FE257_008603 [Aspergillus nanangensis]|uniref:LysM domain-containing protein n=1 Tax=Aspergillus nanangensis TaxID=2582783 RepID=A0AAD4CL85_ASPNN|nr:hypothetical protein FE257_008603 [Aspergillus nanangensis]